MTEKTRQNEQQLIENLNRDHTKVCDKLKLEYEQAKEQFVSIVDDESSARVCLL